MDGWKLMNELPTTAGTYLCTIEATDGNRTWRFTSKCDFCKNFGCFILYKNTGYREICFMHDDSDWTGDLKPVCFDDTERNTAHCKVIAWMQTPKPYTGDGYTGEISGVYPYECN